MTSIASGVDIDQFALDFDSDEACIGIDSYDVVDFDCANTLSELFQPKPTLFDESSDEDDSVEVVSIVFIV